MPKSMNHCLIRLLKPVMVVGREGPVAYFLQFGFRIESLAKFLEWHLREKWNLWLED